MLLKTTKLQYNENGAFVLMEAPNLISCDVNYVNSQSRETQDRTGVYTNQTIDALEVVFKRGVYTFLDSTKPNDTVELKYNNGAFSLQGPFIIDAKYNTKDSTGATYTYISFGTVPTGEYIIAARGGEGGHVDDVEVDGISVVSGGVAEINLTAYAKKTELNEKVNKAGDTMTGNLSMGGHIINMVGGRITNISKGSDDDAVPLKYIKANFAQSTEFNTVKTDLTNEIARSTAKDTELQDAITAEATTRAQADAATNDRIDAIEADYVKAAQLEVEKNARIAADETLTNTKVNKAAGSTDFSIGIDANGIYVED